MGLTIDNRKWSDVLGILSLLKVESLQNDASPFHDQG